MTIDASRQSINAIQNLVELPEFINSLAVSLDLIQVISVLVLAYTSVLIASIQHGLVFKRKVSRTNKLYLVLQAVLKPAEMWLELILFSEVLLMFFHRYPNFIHGLTRNLYPTEVVMLICGWMLIFTISLTRIIILLSDMLDYALDN